MPICCVVVMRVAIIFAVCCLTLAAAYPSLLVKDPYSDSTSCSIDFSCSKPSYDLQDVKISLSPNPPVPGKNLTVTASGTLKKQISGGKITLVAKYNSIQVLNQAYDVCYLTKQLGRQCPISAGPFSGSGTLMVPSFIISGKYYVGVDGTDQDGGNLACGQFTCQL